MYYFLLNLVVTHSLAFLQNLQDVQGIEQVLFRKRLLVLISSDDFRDVVDVVARGVGVGVKGLELGLLRHFCDQIFESVFLSFFGCLVVVPLFFFLFFLQIPLHICDLVLDQVQLLVKFLVLMTINMLVLLLAFHLDISR